jgi:hypothetical protein
MSKLFDDASLAMIPSAYKDGKLYSITPSDGSGDFTFSRGTSATRVNENGLIEKERGNLLTYSNDFSNAAWGKTICSVTGGQSDKDGGTNAWLLEATATNSFHWLQFSRSSTGVETASVYAKAGNHNWIAFYGTSSGNAVWFDLSNGTIGTQSSVPIGAKIEPSTNGYYRISFALGSGFSNFRITVPEGDGLLSCVAGDSIYIQDAQLEQGLVATDYIETTTAAVYEGITDNLPRLDYSGGASCPSLLLEPSRTNALGYSEYFDGWSKIGSPTLTTNYGISPDGLQNSTRFETTSDRITYDVTTINANETFSIYMKGSGTLRIDIGGNNFYPVVTNEWVRYDFTTPLAGTNSNVQIRGNGTAVDVELYGAQYERGSYPTSYIPTYGTSISRNRDVIELGAFVSSFITDATQWTILFDLTGQKDTTRVFKGANNTLDIYSANISGGNTGYRYYWRKDSAYISPSYGQKIIARLSGSTATDFQDGAQTGTLAISGDYSDIGMGFSGVPGCSVNKIVIFPTALTDAECIALTSL